MDIKEYTIILDDYGFPKLKEVKNLGIDQMEITGSSIMYIFSDIYDMDILDTERSYVVSMDNKRHPKAIYQVSMGDYKHCGLFNRSIGIFLLLTAANSFLLVHNHPGDDWEASENDIANKYTLDSFARLHAIEFDGSFIITKSGWSQVGIDELNKWAVYNKEDL